MAKKTNEEKKVRDISATVLRTPAGQAGGLYLQFSNGKVLTIGTHQLSNDILAESLIHGLKQKLVDAGAIPRDTKTGLSATISEKYEAVKAVYDRLLAGQWNETREGGGNAGGMLLRALCRVYPAKNPEKLKAWLDGLGEKEKIALRANPPIAAAIQEIELERAGDVDGDELLQGLPGDDEEENGDDTPN